MKITKSITFLLLLLSASMSSSSEKLIIEISNDAKKVEGIMVEDFQKTFKEIQNPSETTLIIFVEKDLEVERLKSVMIKAQKFGFKEISVSTLGLN